MRDLAATAQLYSARPVVSLDGAEDADLRLGLLSAVVEETVDGLYRCEANFGNWGSVDGEVGYLYLDRRLLDFGRTLALRMGEGEAEAAVFEGRITALEGRFPRQRPPEIQVLAEDRFQDLRMARRSRVFEDATDAEVIERIAADHGLRSEIDLDGPTYPVLSQLNLSDLAFVRERARAVDGEVWIEGSTLHAQARSRRKTAELTLTYGQRLREMAVSADLAEQRTRLTVGGWDVAAKEAIAEEADEAEIRAEIEGGASGPGLLAEAFGERAEQVTHCVPLTTPEGAALAGAHFRRMARRFVRGRATSEGDGRIRAGTHVELRNLGALFDGVYYVTEVRHTFDDRAGYRCHFSVERPFLGAAA